MTALPPCADPPSFRICERNSKCDAPWGVHLKEPNRRSTDRRASDDRWTHSVEVLLPDLCPWVKKRNQLIGVRIDRRKVRTFVRVTTIAG